MDNFVIAVSRYRRRKYQSAIDLCDEMLKQNNLDQSVWILKCSSLIRNVYIDDIEVDEEGVGDILMDENALNPIARPGTSIQRPNSQAGQAIRPMSKQGRLQTGFARPVTHRQAGVQENIIKTARQGAQIGTARPMTQGGRYVRLGTASLFFGDQFIQVDKLDIKKLATKPVISRVLFDYLIYVDHNPRKALQLASEQAHQDWWWRERLGKAYFMLGMYRDAEKQFQGSLHLQQMIKTELQLAKVYLRFDQPTTSIKLYERALDRYPYESQFTIALARVYDLLNNQEKAIEYYKQSLMIDNNIEAVACIAAHHFYIDQPEISLQFYKRLVQLGINNAEVWNNLGLCCFYSGQYDLFYSCFERALQLGDDSTKSDIWYNLSHIFINLGDLGTATQCLKLCLCLNPQHAEAYNNIGVLHSKNGLFDKAKAQFQIANDKNSHLYEPVFNKAYLLYQQQEYSQAYTQVKLT
ncbi:hypothetical protein pb186bvf_013658 [Paramecium bursaria]